MKNRIPILSLEDVEAMAAYSSRDEEQARNKAILDAAREMSSWPVDDEPEIIQQYGTWAVTSFGLMRLDEPNYDLTATELNSSSNWMARFLNEGTVHYDFLRAFIHARAIFYPKPESTPR